MKVGWSSTRCIQWSLVFDLVYQLFKRLDQDEIQTATASVRQEFHYSKVGHFVHSAELTLFRWTT